MMAAIMHRQRAGSAAQYVGADPAIAGILRSFRQIRREKVPAKSGPKTRKGDFKLGSQPNGKTAKAPRSAYTGIYEKNSPEVLSKVRISGRTHPELSRLMRERIVLEKPADLQGRLNEVRARFLELKAAHRKSSDYMLQRLAIICTGDSEQLFQKFAANSGILVSKYGDEHPALVELVALENIDAAPEELLKQYERDRWPFGKPERPVRRPRTRSSSQKPSEARPSGPHSPAPLSGHLRPT